MSEWWTPSPEDDGAIAGGFFAVAKSARYMTARDKNQLFVGDRSRAGLLT